MVYFGKKYITRIEIINNWKCYNTFKIILWCNNTFASKIRNSLFQSMYDKVENYDEDVILCC